MKMFFNLTVSGEDSLEEKFHKALNENENLSMSIVQGFAHVLMLALRLKPQDGFTIEGLKAGKISDTPPAPEQQHEKKIDN